MPRQTEFDATEDPVVHRTAAEAVSGDGLKPDTTELCCLCGDPIGELGYDLVRRQPGGPTTKHSIHPHCLEEAMKR